MTALEKYQRLSGPGLWSGSEEAQRREVAVSFGDATLVISDNRSDMVLSHWSLPAVTRLNPGEVPALFSPEGDPGEVLELDDSWLIDALETLQAALAEPRSQLARWRRAMIGAAVAVSALLAALIVPPALINHTVSVVPLTKRAEITSQVLAELRGQGVLLCRSSFGDSALIALQRRLFVTPARIVVMRGLPENGAGRVLALPGRVFLFDMGLIDQLGSAEAVAGAILSAAQSASVQDPLRPLLNHAGVLASFRLLTTGDLPADAVNGYARAAFARAALIPEPDALRAQFATARLDVAPYAATLADRGTAQALMAQPLPEDTLPPVSVLEDGEWVALLNICES